MSLQLGQSQTSGRVTIQRLLVVAGEEHMSSQSNLNLDIALRKIHELALADGDLGFAYWHEVGQLLQRAGGLQAEIDFLKDELERCRITLTRNRG
jgi:hypothetical protein